MAKREKLQVQFKEITDSLIPLIDGIIARNKEFTSWEELSEEDLKTIGTINWHYLEGFNFEKAAKDGLISKDHAAKIRAFNEWDDSLGGYDN